MNRDAQKRAKRNYNARHPERIRARRKKWEQHNPEKVRAAQNKYRSKPEVLRRMKLREYALTEDAYSAIYNAQAGLCAICFTCLDLLDSRSRHIDHDHVTGAVRGILCRACNLGLGNFKDDAALLSSAAAYLRRSRRQ